jgi:acetyl-CoA C-acetyltransferase
MALDPRTPVLVGAATVEQRLDDPAAAREPAALMHDALVAAAADAGAPSLLARASSIRIPRGFWDYPDPGRLIGERLGATAMRSIVAELGVLQTTLFGHAARAIAAGEEDVALIAGGEAKYRAMRAERAGTAASLTRQPDGVAPDVVLRPHADIHGKLETQHALLMPVNQYAVMENALRHADGQSLATHRRDVAELWASFSRVAAGNPHAWQRQAVGPETIAEASASNRMLAFPYTKLHNSQWNVDQAAGLILCSVAAARAAGIPESRWIFPLAVAESNHMLPLSERAELHRSPGFRLAGERAFAAAGLPPDAVTHVELYSCFPVAVRVQQRELGVAPGRVPTVSGGMAFAGGPLNNFVLQAMARMVEVLRADPGSSGLVTAVSGMLTKQGVSLWSTRAPSRSFTFADVTDSVAAATARVEVTAVDEGRGTVASYTVLYDGTEPSRTILLCDLSDARRTIVSPTDAALARRAVAEELCGRPVRIAAGRVNVE